VHLTVLEILYSCRRLAHTLVCLERSKLIQMAVVMIKTATVGQVVLGTLVGGTRNAVQQTYIGTQLIQRTRLVVQ